MTTKKDNLENRLKQLGEGQEESIGVPEDGFKTQLVSIQKRLQLWVRNKQLQGVQR